MAPVLSWVGFILNLAGIGLAKTTGVDSALPGFTLAACGFALCIVVNELLD
jgi:hypothetical protein